MIARGDHSRRATRALTRLAETDPAFATLALWCRHRDADIEVPAESTDGTVRYGPAFEALSLPEQVGLAAHHVLHIALRHSARGKSLQTRFGGRFDPRAFNLAADAIVNDVLSEAGFVLPRPFVTISGVLDEVLAASEDTRSALAKFDAERLYLRIAAAQGRNGRSRETGRSESRVAGPEALDDYVRAQDFREDLKLEGDRNGGADPQRDDEWAQRLARALDVGQAAGRGIGALARRVAEFEPAATPWEVHLRRLLARATIDDLRREAVRPSRRWLAAAAQAQRAGTGQPGFEPAIVRRKEVPRIAVALDVSGSIDEERLGLFARQVAAIARRSGAELYLVSFDDAVGQTFRLSGTDWAGQLTRMALIGGGGTSFVEPVAEAQSLGASALVVLTDLQGRFGPVPKGLPVIWAVPDARSAPSPPFGRVIDLAA